MSRFLVDPWLRLTWIPSSKRKAVLSYWKFVISFYLSSLLIENLRLHREFIGKESVRFLICLHKDYVNFLLCIMKVLSLTNASYNNYLFLTFHAPANLHNAFQTCDLHGEENRLIHRRDIQHPIQQANAHWLLSISPLLSIEYQSKVMLGFLSSSS